MFCKLFYCILGVVTLIYFDRAIIGGKGQSVTGKSYLVDLSASSAVGTVSLKAHEMIQENLPQRRHQRDLATYDKAGPYSLRPTLDARTRSTILTAVRRFIWDHWHGRSLGHVVTTFYSKEGEPTTYSFFIEADEQGNWGVAVEVNRLLVARTGSKQKYSETEKFIADKVERIDISTDGGIIKAIPKDVPSEPQSFKLRLIEKGKVRFEV